MNNIIVIYAMMFVEVFSFEVHQTFVWVNRTPSHAASGGEVRRAITDGAGGERVLKPVSAKSRLTGT